MTSSIPPLVALPLRSRTDTYDFTAGVNFLPYTIVKFSYDLLDAYAYVCIKVCNLIRSIFNIITCTYFDLDRDITFGAEVQTASRSQKNLVTRDVFRISQPGSVMCTYLSAAAGEAFLRGEDPLELAMVRGMGRALAHYGAMIPPELFQITDPEEAKRELQSIISRFDQQNPDYLDSYLQNHSHYTAFDEIESAFPTLSSRYSLAEIENHLHYTQGLLQRGSHPSTLQVALTRFAEEIDGKGAAVFTIPGNTYSISLEKNQSGGIESISFFDPHGNIEINPSLHRGAYTLKWSGEHALEHASKFMGTHLTGNNSIIPYTLTPLATRN